MSAGRPGGPSPMARGGASSVSPSWIRPMPPLADVRGRTGSTSTTDACSRRCAAPAVVAVVVTHNPGPWFEEALGSLVEQEYPNLSILVVRHGQRHRSHAPHRRGGAQGVRATGSRQNTGPGAAVNTALGMVEGAPFFLVCHDDVALAPNAVRLPGGGGLPLQRRHRRAEARALGPARGPAVGGHGRGPLRDAVRPCANAGELDQEQHDGVARRVLRARRLLPGPRRPVAGPRRVRRGDDLPRRGHRPVLARPPGRCPGAGRPVGPGPPRGGAGRAPARRPPSVASSPPPAHGAHQLRVVPPRSARVSSRRCCRSSRWWSPCVTGRFRHAADTRRRRGPGTCAAPARSLAKRTRVTPAARSPTWSCAACRCAARPA